MNCLFAWVKKKSFFYVLSYLQLAVSFGSFKKTERCICVYRNPEARNESKVIIQVGNYRTTEGFWFETNCDVALVGKEENENFVSNEGR